jgi:hypothetical protein
MNQILPNKKAIFIIGDRLSNKLSMKGLGDMWGCGGSNIFTQNVSNCLLGDSRRYDLVFWDPGHPLSATLELSEIQQVINLPTGNQIIRNYPDHGESWFFEKFYQALSEQEINFLYSAWLRKINFYLECNPSIVLIPLNTAFFDFQIPLKNGVDFLDTLSCKVINCRIDTFSKYPFDGERYRLNDVGWKELEPRIREVING